MSIISNLPARAGVGFKPPHFRDILAAVQPIGFFEVHAENYMGAGGPPHVQLSALRERYALSVHGVGLSIGSMQPLDRDHLARLKVLCDQYQPESFSEHLAWSSHGDVYFNDLLPLPYTRQTLARVAEHVDEVQTALGRMMLLENPSTYVALPKARSRRLTSSPNYRSGPGAGCCSTSTTLLCRQRTTVRSLCHIWTRFRSIG